MLKRWCSIKEIEAHLLCEILISKDTLQGQKNCCKPASINNNWGTYKRTERLYDYKVNTAEDLAKLYLEPHMAKFTGRKLNILQTCCKIFTLF